MVDGHQCGDSLPDRLRKGKVEFSCDSAPVHLAHVLQEIKALKAAADLKWVQRVTSKRFQEVGKILAAQS